MVVEYLILRRVSHYSTVSTSDAVYVIGGKYTRSTIAQFQNGQWNELEDLATGRYRHGSILVDDKTIVIGGASDHS